MSLSTPPARLQAVGFPQRRFGDAALEAHAGVVEKEHEGVSWRLGAHLLLAALPLLAISAHVFGLVPMHLSAGLLVVPLLVVVTVATGFRPVPADRVLLRAAVIGAIATAVYDTIRLDTVYLLGWWGDFIPRIGAWILHTDDPITGLVPNPGLIEVVVGYVWRYVGDGGGIGIWFFIVAAAIGLRERGPAITIAGAVTFAVAPVWAGLIATVAIAPRAGELMFPLTTRTLLLSLLGHLIFGVVLGLGVVRTEGVDKLWPWARIRTLDRALDWVQGGHPPNYDATADPRTPGVMSGPATAGGWSEAVGLARARSGRGGGAYTDLMPPTLPPLERAAEVTQLVSAERLALPPAPPSPPTGFPALCSPAGAAVPPRPRELPRDHPSTPPRPAASPAVVNRTAIHRARPTEVEPASGPLPEARDPRLGPIRRPAGIGGAPPRGRPTPPSPMPVPLGVASWRAEVADGAEGSSGDRAAGQPCPTRLVTDPNPTSTRGVRAPGPTGPTPPRPPAQAGGQPAPAS